MRPPPPPPPSSRAARAALQASTRLGGNDCGDGGGAVLRGALRGARQPLHELHLVGCGLCGGAVAAVRDDLRLLRHSLRCIRLHLEMHTLAPCDAFGGCRCARACSTTTAALASCFSCAAFLCRATASTLPPPRPTRCSRCCAARVASDASASLLRRPPTLRRRPHRHRHQKRGALCRRRRARRCWHTCSAQ